MKFIKLLSVAAALFGFAFIGSAQTLQEATEAYNKAGEMLSSGNLDGVITELEKCVDISKKVGPEADEIRKKAEEILPGQYLQKAKNFVDAKDYPAALKAFDATIAAADKYNNPAVKEDTEKPILQVYYVIGVTAFQAQKYDEAIKALDQAIARDPNFAGAYFIKGACYQSLKDEAKMAESYQLAIEKGKASDDNATAKSALGQYSKYYFNEGIRAMQQKKWDPAIAAFTKAAEVDNSFADAYYRMASCYNSKKVWDSAITNGEKALELKSGGDAKATDGIYYELGLAYFGKKDNGKACECFKKVTSAPYLAAAKHYIDVTLKCK